VSSPDVKTGFHILLCSSPSGVNEFGIYINSSGHWSMITVVCSGLETHPFEVVVTEII
jgi:hypothetical protein